MLSALLVLLCGPLLCSSRPSNYTQDESSYHLPAIRQIRAHWPRLDPVGDSLSATAPGYHYLLAGISVVTGSGTLTMRLINLGISAGLLVMLTRFWPTGRDPWGAFFVIAPLACSNFFVKSAAYVVTDNPALFATAATLLALVAVDYPQGAWWAGIAAASSVFIRQSGAWLAAPLLMRGWAEPTGRGRNLWWSMILMPLLVLTWLAWAWGGLVPPIWQAVQVPEHGLVWSAATYEFAVFAVLAPFYYGSGTPQFWRADLRHPLAWAGAGLGFLLAVVTPTTPNHVMGRWGGYFWNLAARAPAWGEHSLVFVVLAPIGGLMLAMLGRRLWREAGPNRSLTWLGAVMAWSASGLANRQVFHRYYEPTILLLLICWLILIRRSRLPDSVMNFRPLAALGVGQLAVTLVTAYGRTFGFY